MKCAVRVAAAFAAGATIGLASPLAAERASADWVAAAHAAWKPARPASDVALVLLDRRALAHPAFAGRSRADWGAPIARVVVRLLDARARTVALDVVLPRDDTAALLRTIRRATREGRLVLGMVAGAAGATPSRAQLAAVGGVSGLASVNLETDADGRVRALAPVNGALPVIGAALAQRAGAGIVGPARITRGAVPSITAWSAADLLDCDASATLTEAFADRSVLVGAWLPHEDRHASALGRLPRATRTLPSRDCGGAALPRAFDGDTPGVLLHALAADRWLHRAPLDALPRSAQHALILAAALVGACVQRPRRQCLLVVVAPPALFAVALAAAHTWLLPWLALSAALVAATGVSTVLRFAWQAARLAATVPRAFRATPDAAATRTITACFIDIASFTAATESIADPARVASELAACLQRLAGIVERHDGFVDKYLGDGLFAVFGIDGRDGRADAAAAAAACLAECADGNLRLADRPLALRIGLATGPARVGNLHGGPRLHFTAIGDVVNVAARLEQLNRSLGTRVLADEAVVAGAPDSHWRDRGRHALRGRHASVRVFELTDAAPRL